MDTKKIKILYAEDNRITAQETGEALEDNGYEVKTVFDGDEAWLAYQSTRPYVVVLDYQMPGKTGIEVFLLIRQLDKKIPVLILSSYTELCAASLKIGTSDFVRKDGGIDELCARIEAALNRYPGPEITGHPSEKVYQLSPTSRFYPANSTLEIGDQRYPLKTMLAELLTIYCQNQNSFIPGTIICRRLWNNDNASKISLLRDYISELRKILKADTSLKIRSSYGKGYCFSTPEK